MFLKELSVIYNDDVVTSIPFKDGLNLIIDKSRKKIDESGSGVGKTTALRAIDFCLGGDVGELYKDKEFKNRINQDVYDFVHRPGVTFRLSLRNEPHSKLITIDRSADQPGGVVEGEEYDRDTFQRRLKELIFGIAVQKPSFRQLIGKFVRIQDYQLQNTVHFLYPSTAKSDYTPVLLYLFGFPEPGLLDSWRAQNADLQKEKARRQALVRGDEQLSISALRQAIHVLDQRILRREIEIRNYNVGIGVEAELTQLKAVRAEISELSMNLAHLDTAIRLSETTLDDLEDSQVDIDEAIVKSLYETAIGQVPSAQVELEKVLDFHHRMMSQKTRYVKARLVEFRKEREKNRGIMEGRLNEEQKLLQFIGEKDALADLRKLQRTLDDLYQEKGKRVGLLEKLETIETTINNLETGLSDIQDEIIKHKTTVEDRLFMFNEIFSLFSEEIYGTGYILDLGIRQDGGILKVQPGIVNAIGNPSTGAKKGEISAFDLAYVQYLAATGQSGPRFTVYDKIENVDITELGKIFSIANRVPGQYVVAVLKERINGLGRDFIEKNKVLELTQKNKFLGI
jgi:uncharacterized protein YydD (DUF2326 family)